MKVVSTSSTTDAAVPEPEGERSRTQRHNIDENMSNGFMYILECSDGSYYTGSTVDLELRLIQHQAGEGANHTKKRLPVKLVYYEEYQRIDEAFYREKQVQGWSRKKKEALIKNRPEDLPLLSKNYTQYPNGMVVSTASDMVVSTSSTTDAAVPEPPMSLS